MGIAGIKRYQHRAGRFAGRAGNDFRPLREALLKIATERGGPLQSVNPETAAPCYSSM